MLGTVDLLHFRQFRQAGQGLASHVALHRPDRDVHPDQRHGRDQEHEHEAARPNTGQVVQRTEGDRQHETAQAANEANDASDSTDMLRIVDRDVLVDRGLAQAHEEAQHEGDYGKGYEPHLQRERDRSVDSLHHVLGRRIGHHETGGDRDAEGPVHHAPGAEFVRQDAAIDAEQAGRHGVGRADHACGRYVEAVDAHPVARQPQCQSHKAAEDEKVVKREAPDLDVSQRFQHRQNRLRLGPGLAPRRDLRVILGREPERQRRDHQRDRPDVGDGLPAVGDHDERCQELGNGRPDIAGAEDAQRRALLAWPVPAGHVGDADGEGAASDADAERRQKKGGIVVGVGEQPGRNGSREHDADVDDTPAVLICPDAEDETNQRARQDRRAHQQAELRISEAEVFLDLDADDGKDRPHGEADREGECAHAKRYAAPLWRGLLNARRLLHRILPAASHTDDAGKTSERHAERRLTQIKPGAGGVNLRLFVLFCERMPFTFGKSRTGVRLSHVNEDQN